MSPASSHNFTIRKTHYPMSQMDPFLNFSFSPPVRLFFVSLPSRGRVWCTQYRELKSVLAETVRVAPVHICPIQAKGRRGKTRFTVNVLDDQEPRSVGEGGRGAGRCLETLPKHQEVAWLFPGMSQSCGAVALASLAQSGTDVACDSQLSETPCP